MYQPGSKNTKADALSCMHHTPALTSVPETILPLSCLVKAIAREFDREFEATLPCHVPVEGLPGRTYIPSA